MPRFRPEDLRRLGEGFFTRLGVPVEEARLVADHLVEAGLTGHDTHGVLRLPQYVGMLRSGQVRPGAPLTVLSRSVGAARVSGGWNFGPVTATAAVGLALELAGETAASVVTVRDCNHVARLGRFVEAVAAAGRIGVMAANGHGGDLAVAPHGGRERRLPTNPLCVAIPTGQGWPLVLDMTTSALSGGALRLLRNLGQPAPEDALIDATGRPTTEVESYYGPPAGALLPLGHPLGGHKGFGLALVVDVLAGALSGAGCSRGDAEVSGNALFILVLRPESFLPPAEFIAEVDRLINWVKSSPPAPGFSEVLVPGERAWRAREERQRQGLEVDATAWEQITALAGELGVVPPKPVVER